MGIITPYWARRSWWRIATYEAWATLRSCTSIDQRWEFREAHQDERNAERYRSWALRFKLNG